MKGQALKFLAIAATLTYAAAALTFAGRIWWKSSAAAGIAALIVWLWMSWYAAALLGTALRFRYLTRWEEWQRYTQGLCVQCGYDLRASHLRCPECGRAAPKKYRP